MKTTTNTFPASVVAVYDSLKDTMVRLSGRWADEGKYENIADYAAEIVKQVSPSVNVLKMVKRPFGVHLMIDGGIYLLSCGARTYTLKELTAPPLIAPKADEPDVAVSTTTTSDWEDPAAAPKGETPAMTEDEADEEITPCPGAFAALASTLTAEQAEAAEDAAIAAIVKAKAPRKATAPTTNRTAALVAPYRLGAYKGRAGAMYDFMARCGTLGDDFTREDVCASIIAKPCHAAVATRAQALDYFAWAARHGLLVELTAAEQQVRADRMADAASGAAEKKLNAKAARAARRAAKKVAA